MKSSSSSPPKLPVAALSREGLDLQKWTHVIQNDWNESLRTIARCNTSNARRLPAPLLLPRGHQNTPSSVLEQSSISVVAPNMALQYRTPVRIRYMPIIDLRMIVYQRKVLHSQTDSKVMLAKNRENAIDKAVLVGQHIPSFGRKPVKRRAEREAARVMCEAGLLR